jgi:hypothetical protein
MGGRHDAESCGGRRLVPNTAAKALIACAGGAFTDTAPHPASPLSHIDTIALDELSFTWTTYTRNKRALSSPLP